jgi:endonuclease/exonuclease/phosphatase (EEP) superfamily protein YafD
MPRMFPVRTSRARSLGVLALAALASASVFAWLAALGWPFELFAHFRWQLVAAGFLLGAALLLMRLRLLAVAALLLAATHALPLLRAFQFGPSGTKCGAEASLRIVTANVQYLNNDHARFIAWLAANPADIVVVQEVTDAWSASLQATLAPYPYRALIPRADAYGIAVLSRRPMQALPVDLAGDTLPSLLVTIATSAGPLRVIAMHTRWPVTPSLIALRDRSLTRAAQLVRATPTRTVLAGDLNVTPYAPRFGELLRKSGLRDALATRAWRPTWEASAWPVALPLDHVLVPPQACVNAVVIGPEIGSDHRPLLVALSWPR